jgi:translation initiation factor 4A|tara:strand:- start:772 stop:1935 length:1164 start_codon:yes stop_codon:yes gene_type:complete
MTEPQEAQELQIYETFDDMDLKEDILRGIYSYGFEKPSSIQQRAIKPLIEGKDLIAQAHSGTGKTATFTIGALEIIDKSIMKPQVIILAPNRELAMQIFNVFNSLNDYHGVKGGLIMGGTDLRENFKILDEGVQYIVGTPGRIYDMLKRYALVTDSIKSFILDEADEMLSRGFKEQIYEIFQFIPKECQVCLFSATMPEMALEIAKKFMREPTRILVNKEQLTLEGIKQYYLGVEQESWKLATLQDLYEKLSISQSIIFVNSKRKADFLKEQLEQNDYTVECIHGDLTQKDRNEIMQSFRNGNSRILITTDIIARGIDIQTVSIVINYDIPRYREVYIHRIGRSGRFGRKGIAINFVTEREYNNLKEIQDFYQTEIIPLPENIKDLL